jgi:DNA helicase-2/ATP-dependent DNA helicase PcrA
LCSFLADFVVKHVKDLVSSGTYGPDNSVAFIYRTNAQSRALEEACVLHNLPYVIFGSATSFYKRPEIKDCLSFLRWMYNGRDRSSMLRAMKTPSRGLGDVAVREFDDYCTRIDEYFEVNHAGSPQPTPFDVLLLFSSQKPLSEGFPLPSESLSTRPLKLLTAFSVQMRFIRDMAYTSSVERVLALIIETLELIPHFDKISKSKAEFEERQANVRELRKASERYTKSGACLSNDGVIAENIDEFTQSPLGTFLDDVSLVTEMADAAERSGEERFVASLMTIHASKGMEFDSVFVVGNEDGTFPTSQALQEGSGSVVLEEERRLCYVAMTRAKTELFMTWRREVNIFTPDGVRTVDKDRSRFLDVLVSSKGKKTAGSGSKSTNGSGPVTRSPPSFRGTTNAYSSQTNRRKPEANSGQDRYRSPVSQPQRPPERAANVSPKRPSASARLEGTASVYAKKSPSPLDQATSSESGRPSRSTRQSPAISRPSEERAPPSKRSTKPQPARQTMDSTWFFPIGSEVVHANHGRGIVLPPPQPQDQGALPVLVKFGDGERREFCGRGSDLTPIVP